MPTAQYKLFISHTWCYCNIYNQAIDCLNQAQEFSWANFSVPEAKAYSTLTKAALEAELNRQIAAADCVIVLSDLYYSAPEWIQYQLDVALALKKPILGLVSSGATRTPAVVTAVAQKMVNWSSSSIATGIKSLCQPVPKN